MWIMEKLFRAMPHRQASRGFQFHSRQILAYQNPGAPQGPNATETGMLPDLVGDEDNPN